MCGVILKMNLNTIDKFKQYLTTCGSTQRVTPIQKFEFKKRTRFCKHLLLWSLVSWQCWDGWVPFTMIHALLPLYEERVSFTVDVLLKRHAGLFQVGQGASGITQLLLQRCHNGFNLPHLPFQTETRWWWDKDKENWVSGFVYTYLSWGSSLQSSMFGLRERRWSLDWATLSGASLLWMACCRTTMFLSWAPICSKICTSDHSVISHLLLLSQIVVGVPVQASSPAAPWLLSAPHSAGWRLGPHWSTGLSDLQWCPSAFAPPALWPMIEHQYVYG